MRIPVHVPMVAYLRDLGLYSPYLNGVTPIHTCSGGGNLSQLISSLNKEAWSELHGPCYIDKSFEGVVSFSCIALKLVFSTQSVG